MQLLWCLSLDFLQVWSWPVSLQEREGGSLFQDSPKLPQSTPSMGFCSEGSALHWNNKESSSLLLFGCQDITHSSVLPGADDNHDMHKDNGSTSEVPAPGSLQSRNSSSYKQLVSPSTWARLPNTLPGLGLVLSTPRAQRVFLWRNSNIWFHTIDTVQLDKNRQLAWKSPQSTRWAIKSFSLYKQHLH